MERFEARLRAEGSFYAYNKERVSAERELALLLSQFQFFRLRILTQGKNKGIKLPVESRHTVLLNGDKASFADVIAFYKLLQTKHSMKSSPIVQVNMPEELWEVLPIPQKRRPSPPRPCCYLARNVRRNIWTP